MKSSLMSVIRARCAALWFSVIFAAQAALAQEVETEATRSRGEPAQATSPPTLSRQEAQKAARAVARALAELEDEPSLEELEHAALRVARADPGSVEGWMQAPRRSAWLPVLKLSADHRSGRDESLDRDQINPDEWGADTDRGFGVGISMQWNLSELVFNSDEIRVHGALEDRAKRREGVLMTLINTWFERRRLQLELRLSPPSDPLEYARIRLAIQSLGATIDALTGGQLSRNLSKTEVSPGR